MTAIELLKETAEQRHMAIEKVLALAAEVGAKFDPDWGIAYNCGTETFVRFAALVTQACADKIEHTSIETYGVLLREHKEAADWMRSNTGVTGK